MTKRTEEQTYIALSEVNEMMLKTTFQIIRAAEHDHGLVAGRNLFLNYLTSMIATAVYDSLINPRSADGKSLLPPNDDQTRQYEATQTSFAVLKSQIAEAVGSGFAGGFSQFAPGMPLEYFVKIVPVGEPSSKVPS